MNDKVVSVENQPGGAERHECFNALSAPDGANLKRNNRKRVSSLLGILRYILRYKFSVSVVILAAVAGNMLALTVPRLTGEMVDTLAAGHPEMPVVLISSALTIVGVSLLSWILSVLQNMIMLRTAQNVVTRLRHDVFTKLTALPVSFFDTRSKGDIISVVSGDIDNVSETVSSDAVTLISGFVTVVGALSMMAAINPTLMLVFAVTVPVMAVAARVISKRARVLHHSRKNTFGKMCGYIEEMITAQKTVKAYGIEDGNMGKFKGINSDLNARSARAESQSGYMMPVMNGLSNLNFTLICLFGAFFVLSGRMTVGGISSFVMYAKRFSQPIVDTANIINMFQASLAACDRVFTVLNAGEEPRGVIEPGGEVCESSLNGTEENTILPAKTQHGTEENPTPGAEKIVVSNEPGSVVFEDVRFGYNPGQPVLKGVSVNIRAGECAAIVGATGSGKTTLASLLLRFYDVTGGRILLDGRDIRDMPLPELRQNFAVVLQDSWLFNGTVYENIAYAAPPGNADASRIRRVCEEISVDDFITALPDGYDSVLYNDSGGLSAGQKQLINIARAFLCDKPVLILDEATSAVDTLIEQRIRRVTERVIAGRTSIIIAHRLSTILRADVILVMKDGLICESGSHDKLMALGGEYKKLYDSRFEDADES